MQKLMARACWLAGCRAAELQVKCRVLGVAQGPPPGPLPSHGLLGTSCSTAFQLLLACYAACIPGYMVHPEPAAWEGWLGDRVHLAPCLGAGPLHQNYVAHSCCFIWLRPIQPPRLELPLLFAHAMRGSTLPRKIVHWAGGLHVGGASRWGGGAARGTAATMGHAAQAACSHDQPACSSCAARCAHASSAQHMGVEGRQQGNRGRWRRRRTGL